MTELIPARRSRQEGTTLLAVVAVLALACLLLGGVVLFEDMSRRMDTVQNEGIPAGGSNAPFVEAWSVAVNPALILEMALSPGRAGEFLALNSDEISRFDQSGARLGGFAAPRNSSRIASDPTGSIPYVLVVSSNTKWTGAIDYTNTTDHFLQALDRRGREIWKKRFDPKVVSTLEPIVATLNSRTVVVLSASRRILCFDSEGAELWDVPLWHHPGSVTAVDLAGHGAGTLLAALAPGKEIVHIGHLGTVIGPWGIGEGPRRFRAMKTASGTAAVSLRQVFGRGQGVRHALAFFDGEGTMIEEVELPPDSSPLSYAPITAMDIDGSGRRNWIVALADGTILAFSPLGEELARHATGARLRTVLTFPQSSGGDILITATNRGLTAWRPVPDRFRPVR